MFIILPLGIFILSLLLIGAVIVRKLAFLRKLSPEVLENSAVNYRGFWEELLPEAGGIIKFIKSHEWRLKLLEQFEKLFSLLKSISSLIDSLFHKILLLVKRKAKQSEQIVIKEEIKEQKEKAEIEEAIEAISEHNGSDIREEEQLLIINIAKNPRDPELYRRLGDIYIKTEEYDDARQCFEKAIELNPRDIASRGKLKKVLAKLPPA
ncbi:MAG: hypothetical protein CEN90_175 [Parcubacteria group bacterium Licking1014_17]|nr:MAG: hypothetical protein CEN90_175 [Parcubacteria group bacterium Licking1014_17]